MIKLSIYLLYLRNDLKRDSIDFKIKCLIHNTFLIFFKSISYTIKIKRSYEAIQNTHRRTRELLNLDSALAEGTGRTTDKTLPSQETYAVVGNGKLVDFNSPMVPTSLPDGNKAQIPGKTHCVTRRHSRISNNNPCELY